MIVTGNEADQLNSFLKVRNLFRVNQRRNYESFFVKNWNEPFNAYVFLL